MPEDHTERKLQMSIRPLYALYVLGLLAFFIILTALVIWKGVKGGIEKWSKILMPLLLIILFALVIRSVTLPGASKGLAFYLKPDFSKINVTGKK